MNLSLVRFGPTPSVEINQSAHDAKADALGTAALVSVVTTPAQQEFAVGALRDIKAIKKGIEEARVAVKAPVLKLGKDIDECARVFCAELDAEDKRITTLVSTYQQAEIRKAHDAEAARQRELQRIEAERLAAEREAQRLADEEIRKARSLEQAEVAAVKAEQSVAKATQEAAVAKVAVYTAPSVSPARAEGMQVRRVPKFEVLDVRSLALARPDLVRIEVNAAAVNKEILAGNTTISGLKCWVETGVGVRS